MPAGTLRLRMFTIISCGQKSSITAGYYAAIIFQERGVMPGSSFRINTLDRLQTLEND